MSFASRDYHEKRNFIRMKVDASVTLTVPPTETTMTGQCHDLSGGGLLIEIPRALPLGSEVEVSLESSHGHNPMLKARAQINRIKTRPKPGTASCLAGLEILEMID